MRFLRVIGMKCQIGDVITLVVLVVLFCGVTAFGGPAWGAGGTLLWEDQVTPASAAAVAASQGRVVAVGSAQNGAGNSDFLVRSYDGDSGTLLWQDLFDFAGGDGGATAVVMQAQQVVAVGSGTDANGEVLSLIRAYDADDGTLNWEDQLTSGTALTAVVMQAQRVVAVGSRSTDANGAVKLLVRAYNAQNGQLVWEDQSLPSGVRLFGGTTNRAVAVDGTRVFVVATVQSLETFRPLCLVRAYDLTNGDLVWESVSAVVCSSNAVAAGGAQIVVAERGSPALDDFQVQSYDAATGGLLWQDRTLVSTGFDNAAVAVDLEGRRAFVAGWVRLVPGTFNQEAFLVRAYDAEAGQLLWEDQFPGTSFCLCQAYAVTAEGPLVIAVGTTGGDSTIGNGIIRAYDANTGDLVWHDESCSEFKAKDVATDGRLVFVAGSGPTARGNNFILRTYSAK